ncbi:MAG: hypothetical protein K2K08_03650 [Paramuribaculum sp.]|nr:hypothetical protein [Paramuribaculum sp.]
MRRHYPQPALSLGWGYSQNRSCGAHCSFPSVTTTQPPRGHFLMRASVLRAPAEYGQDASISPPPLAKDSTGGAPLCSGRVRTGCIMSDTTTDEG